MTWKILEVLAQILMMFLGLAVLGRAAGDDGDKE